MKTQKKNRQRLYLQKSNNRWKWMAGATAATVAGVSVSEAGLITVNLTNNYISATGGNHLNADVTGDGHPDLILTGAFYHRGNTHSHGTGVLFYTSSVGVRINGIRAFAFSSADSQGRNISFGSQYATFYARSLTGSLPIFFKDLRINGGTPTAGSLKVTVEIGSPQIQLDSFTYTSNTPVDRSRISVPDQGSSLALLAMGAGGVLALRRWRASQKTP